jgi:SAM-dependent methyltransferase
MNDKTLNYFNESARTRIRYRKRKSYYWNSITKYCDFFIYPENSILEIGCGTGELIDKVRGKKKSGVDFSPVMIGEAKKQFPNIDFRVADAHNLGSDEKYDVIIMSNLIGFLDDIQTAFREIHKVSHPRSRIIITYYNFVWEPLIKFAESIGLKKKSPTQSWLSKQDIINLLYLAGFETYRTHREMLIPYNIPLISWFFNKIIARLPLFNLLCLNQYLFARPIPANTDKDQYSVTVVVPARNESGNIEDAIKRLPKMGRDTQLIYIEGNSTDDTWEKINEVYNKYKDTHNLKIAKQPGKGKGDAVRKGYDMADGDILMILDADLTVPPEDLSKFYDAIATGKGEFINGSRLVYPMEKNAMRLLNALGNKSFSILFSWLLEQPIKDTLCGTKVMFRDDYIKLTQNRKFFGDFDPFGDFDLLFGAYKLNLKIIDLPIRYRERKYGSTNISRFKHGVLLLRMFGYASRKIKFW